MPKFKIWHILTPELPHKGMTTSKQKSINSNGVRHSFFYLTILFFLPFFTSYPSFSQTANKSTPKEALLAEYIANYKQGLESENNPDSTYLYLNKARQLANEIAAAVKQL